MNSFSCSVILWYIPCGLLVRALQSDREQSVSFTMCPPNTSLDNRKLLSRKENPRGCGRQRGVAAVALNVEPLLLPSPPRVCPGRLLISSDNQCPDINNYDKSLGDHEFPGFGDINDPDAQCSCCGLDTTCTWYEGTLSIGEETFVGEAEELCERP